MTPLLEVRGLRVRFKNPDGGYLYALDGLELAIAARSTVGLVGESGCGKSTLALSILRLVPPPGQLEGQILYRPAGGAAVDLLRLPETALRALRGSRISMIFQEPMTSLNPVYTAGDQVAEVLRVHRGLGRKEARAETVRLFQQVGIGDPVRRLDEYPHQLSGGMRQRVMIAMALACHPDLLIADEPTTALDVTVQAQILALLARLQAELGMSILLITHDLGVVAQLCAEVMVLYAGQVVECGPTAALFTAPAHPYTAGLLRCLPRLRRGAKGRTRLREIPGLVPSPDAYPVGCRFQDRCPQARERCRLEPPALQAYNGRQVRCHFPLEGTGERMAEGVQ
ncbi:MAG: ABC transporter ATP-binding protein [Myxococcales bacterium]|nr:ABC transporter ATP-binding protein [Myxococcota bacterium]MDW8283483.1 ABC transporter ATP-binding protein [Myxococcales bacterium]